MLLEKNFISSNEDQSSNEYIKNINFFWNFLECENVSSVVENIYNILLSYNWTAKERSIIEGFDFISDEDIDSEFNCSKNFFFIFLSLFIVKSLVNIKTNSNKNYDIKDGYDVINECELNFKKIAVWLNIKKKKKNSLDFNIKHIIFKSLEIMVYNELLLTITIKINNNSTKFYYFKKKISFSDINLNISLTPLHYFKTEDNVYTYSNHFTSINEVFKKNVDSQHKFEWFDLNTFKSLCDNPIRIDFTLFSLIYEEFLKEKDLVGVALETEYCDLIDKYIVAISQKEIAAQILISQKMAVVNKALVLKKIFTMHLFDIDIYLNFFFDFRGRLYFRSEISPTYIIELRYCLYSNSNEINKTDNTSKLIFYKLKNLLLSKFNYINDLKKNISIDENSKEIIIWYLISLAEIDKKKFGKKAHIDQLLLNAIKIFNDEIQLNLKYESRIKLLFLKHIINKRLDNFKTNYFLPKDATASVYQHLIKTLGQSHNEGLTYCNLYSEDTWYDTYSYIIDIFLSNRKFNSLSDEESITVFNRASLKKTIMTEKYSATKNTCWKYFLEEIPFNNFSDLQKKEIKETFDIFYKFIKNDTILLQNSPQKIKDFFKKEKIAILYDSARVNYVYKKFENKEVDLIIYKKRKTKKFKIYSSIDDTIKFNNSIKANYIQTLDGCLVRWAYSNNLKLIPIHDCFMFESNNITIGQAIIIMGMRQNFHSILQNNINCDIIYSPFILF